MRILHIISSDGGGVSTYVKNIVKELHSSHKFEVLSFGQFGNEFLSLQNEKKCKLVVMESPRKIGIYKFVAFLKNYFKINSFDFIECHIPGYHGLLFRMCSINKCKNFSIHSHQTDLSNNTIKGYKRKLIILINQIINRIISKKGISCGISASNYGFGSNYDSYIIYNSVSTNFIEKNKNNRNNRKNISVGFFGRHTKQKNLDFIIELAKYTSRVNKEIEYYIYGDGELTLDFKNKIISNKIDNIYLVGRTNDVLNEMLNMDVNILPSLSEGLPTVLIEAQSVKLPSVVSNFVTKEVDIGLGLLKYLPIDKTLENLEEWTKSIIYYKSINISVNNNQIINALREKEFTINEMANKFQKYLDTHV